LSRDIFALGHVVSLACCPLGCDAGTLARINDGSGTGVGLKDSSVVGAGGAVDGKVTRSGSPANCVDEAPPLVTVIPTVDGSGTGASRKLAR
jgi:hypothetical protein